MICTLTTTAVGAMNASDTYTSGVSGTPSYVLATGGNVLKALPFCMSKNGSLAASTALALPVHTSDFLTMPVDGLGFNSRDQFNWAVQAGLCTVSIASQTGQRDVFDVMVDSVL